MLELAILLAISVTFIVDYSNAYGWILNKFKRLDRKPFSCSLCMSFWSAVLFVIGSIVFEVFTFNYIFLPFVTGMFQIIISRLIRLIPIKF